MKTDTILLGLLLGSILTLLGLQIYHHAISLLRAWRRSRILRALRAQNRACGTILQKI